LKVIGVTIQAGKARLDGISRLNFSLFLEDM
jgi:hypothetical protein